MAAYTVTNHLVSELLKSLGVPLIVDDLYSLDADSLAALQPLRALIFLFKWIPTSLQTAPSRAGTDDSEFPGFFAHQVVNNACATLAVLNALGNIPSLECGPKLADLLQFTTGMDPQTRGLVVTSSDWLREMHNALSPPNAFSLDGLGLPKKAEDAYHFVVYLPVMGAVYELDGLQRHPLRHGGFEDVGEGWVKAARCFANYTSLSVPTDTFCCPREVIETRISTYPVGAVRIDVTFFQFHSPRK